MIDHSIGSVFKVNPCSKWEHKFFRFDEQTPCYYIVQKPAIALFMGITSCSQQYIFLVEGVLVTENPLHVDACWVPILSASDT